MRREAMAESARRARPEFLYAPHREMHVYRQLLPHAPPGTAAWFGALGGRSDRLLLERIDGLELRLVGTFAMWEETARWVARLHHAFTPATLTRLVPLDDLLVYDEAFYRLWLERAQRFAAQRPAERRLLDRVAERYSAIVDRLTTLPRTLIHGEFYPCNVLIATSGEAVRICPVDWEMAAIGPGLIDLAALTTGWDAPQQDALIRAYRLAAADDRSARESAIDFDCCRLHLAIRMLGWSEAWVPPPQHAHDWLAEAERLVNRLSLLT
jgi:aminoglycoside phosphotransferase (APT) family kinase protein